MRISSKLSNSAFILAIVGLLLPPVHGVRAQTRDQRKLTLLEVSLDSENRLRGQVVDAQGQQAANHAVVLVRSGEPQISVQTNSEGRFAFQLAQGGTYQLVTGDETVALRAWTRKAAPPNCLSEILIVCGRVERGQKGLPPTNLINPWFVAGVVAAAVAVPVIMHQNRVDRGKGS